MNILLTGATGQLGFELCRALAPLGNLVAPGRDQCDLSNAAMLRQCLRDTRPALVVNAAAYTAVDRAETEVAQAHAVNAEALAVLAEEAGHLGAGIIHYSTDYVFDGRKPAAYVETDASAPLNAYGRSKRAGEEILLAAGLPCWIFRSSWLYGVHGHNFLKTMLEQAVRQDSMAVVADQYGAPTSAALVADVTAQAVRAMQAGRPLEYGIYHVAAAGYTSWHEYARHLLARAATRGMALQCTPEHVRAILARDHMAAALRPANSRLDCSKLEAALQIRLPDWRLGVNRTIDLLTENAAA